MTIQPASLLAPASTIASAVVAVLFLYDAKRALWPRIPGEQPWRRARLVGTTAAVLAMAVLHRAGGSVWLGRLALATLVVGLVVVLRCSIALRRMVAVRLLQPRDS